MYEVNEFSTAGTTHAAAISSQYGRDLGTLSMCGVAGDDFTLARPDAKGHAVGGRPRAAGGNAEEFKPSDYSDLQMSVAVAKL